MRATTIEDQARLYFIESGDPFLCPICKELDVRRVDTAFGSDEIGLTAYYECDNCHNYWHIDFLPCKEDL
jgi:DNA-directed RNA polymerase subunit M/transcription elongation factor TFIIS